jgi:hypothetical protein
MRYYPALVVAFLTLSLPLLSPAESTNPALKKFQKEMEELAVFTKTEGAKLKDNPFNGVLMVRNVGAQLWPIDSENLPDDLRSAFNDFVIAISVFGDLYQGWPEKVDEINDFIKKENEKDPDFAVNLQKKTEAAAKKLGPAQARLDEVSKKYGVTLPANS